jgi:hypothetical protein
MPLNQTYAWLGSITLILLLSLPATIHFWKNGYIGRGMLNAFLNTMLIFSIITQDGPDNNISVYSVIILFFSAATVSASFVGFSSYRALVKYQTKKGKGLLRIQIPAIAGFFTSILLHLSGIITICLIMHHYDMKDRSKYHNHNRPGPGELPCF